MVQIFIKNEEDRKTIVGILAVNGYKVAITKVKDGKVNKSVVEFEAQDTQKGN
jgi:hypothetical protein